LDAKLKAKKRKMDPIEGIGCKTQGEKMKSESNRGYWMQNSKRKREK